MRKYLMTGMAALAICAAFTSCSKDTDVYNSDQPKQDIQATYEQNFIKVFGQPAANQDWGFGSVAKTRGTRGAINVNGNMWDTCPEVDSPDEVNAIFNYVNHTLPEMDNLHHRYSTTAPQNINGYFVTQVRNGKNADNVYTAFDGSEKKDVGGYMNHLQVAFNSNPSMSDLVNEGNNSGWTHINNFNASDNANYGGNTKVEDAGAYDFAYHNSLDSKYHNNWILIDGADITSDGKYKNYLYVCFDFESTPECVTKFRFKYKGQEYGDVRYNGAYTAQQAVENQLKVTINVWDAEQNASVPTEINLATDIDPWDRDGAYNGLCVDNVENGDKKVDPDDIHTDWIVRITKGEPEYDIRIIGEDLSAGEDGNDFDFNDVVFDVKFTGDNTAKICIVAAGGTLPLRVAGREVHAEFNQNTNIMINTNAADAGYPNQAYEQRTNLPTFTITLDGVKAANGKNIKIEVEKEVNGVKQWVELKANNGEPAAKIGVKPGFGYCNERQGISSKYPLFTQWVQNVDVVWYLKDAE